MEWTRKFTPNPLAHSVDTARGSLYDDADTTVVDKYV